MNGVAVVETSLPPGDLLALLHEIERRFGRERREVNAARILDLDLIAYGDLVRTDAPPLLPHPRLHERAFVLLPLADVAPDWRHPGRWPDPARDDPRPAGGAVDSAASRATE